MIMAISACPMTVAQILDLSDRIAKDELKIDDLVDGLMDFNEELTGDAESADSDEEKTTKATRAPSRARTSSGSRSPRWSTSPSIRKHHTRMLACCRRKATRRRSTSSTSARSAAELMQIRFSARQVERLCDSVRTEVDNIARSSARSRTSW
jgi:RNA polymerase primary sigma factor